MNRYATCILVLAACGCSKPDAVTEPIASTEAPNASDTNQSQTETLDFAGTTWTLDETPGNHGDVSRTAMNARAYVGASPTVRVIEFFGRNPATTLSEGVFKRILQQQVQTGGRWVSDGPGERWLLDGTHEAGSYSNGEPDGLRKIWHANGKLKLTETYANGKRTGTSTAYYDNGQIEWTATYVNDLEIDGAAFDRDGNKL